MSGATLPEGWSLKRLDELARVTSGKRLPKGRRLSTAQTDHPYIRVTDMFMGGVDSSGIQYVPDDVFPEIAQFTVASGDIFISCAGTLGLVGIVPKSLHGANLTENANRIWSIQCDRRFLLSVLMSDRIQSVIQNIQTVGAQPKLALGRIRSFEIPCPVDPHEQQAIAAALSDADGVVAGLERVIAKKRLIKQGAMQDLLTARRRLPGFSGEWEVSSLGSVLRRSPSYGINAPAIPRGTGGFAYLRITDISDDGTVDPSGLPSVREGASDQYLLAEGDIVVARTGASVGKSHLFRDIGEPVIFAGFLIRLCPDVTKLLPSFLSQFMQTQNYWDWVRENSARSGQPGVNGQQLRTILLKLPEIEEQQAIAAVLSDMDAEIQTLESRLAKARAVKEGMMQNLLTGRVRLV